MLHIGELNVSEQNYFFYGELNVSEQNYFFYGELNVSELNVVNLMSSPLKSATVM